MKNYLYIILFCIYSILTPVCFVHANQSSNATIQPTPTFTNNLSEPEVLWMNYQLTRIHVHRILNRAEKTADPPLEAMENLFGTAHLIATHSPEAPFISDVLEDLFELLEKFKQLQRQNSISFFAEGELIQNQFGTGDLLSKVRDYCSKHGAAMLDYFWGRENLFLLIIYNNGVTLQKTPLDGSFAENLNFVSANLERFDPELNPIHFLQAVKKLSVALIPNLEKILAPATDELVIIPDGLLFNLSFDILLPDNPGIVEEMTFKSAPFLIKSFAISYVTQANALFVSNIVANTNPEDILFAGFAPEFPKAGLLCASATNAEFLSCNLDEVESIADQISGEVFLGKHASLENIKHTGSRAKILHLATHACYHEDAPTDNSLHLHDTSIYLKDWNTLSIQGDLLVLSACNTAKMNFSNPGPAHNFISLGVPAVVASLWTQEDCVASRIMFDFYRALFQGNRQNVALRKAKLQFLGSASKIYQHPYFWASYISLGRQMSLNPQKSCRNRLLFLSILGSMVFFAARHT